MVKAEINTIFALSKLRSEYEHYRIILKTYDFQENVNADGHVVGWTDTSLIPRAARSLAEDLDRVARAYERWNENLKFLSSILWKYKVEHRGNGVFELVEITV